MTKSQHLQWAIIFGLVSVWFVLDNILGNYGSLTWRWIHAGLTIGVTLFFALNYAIKRRRKSN
jgi:hypothetical protein